MLKRYLDWAEANPLWDWLLSAAVGLTVIVGGSRLIPGPRNPGLTLFFVVLALSGPTAVLRQRFSDERRQARPIRPSQERGVGILAVTVAAGGIAAFGGCLLGGLWGWSMDTRGPLLMVWSVSALLSLGLGHAARDTAAGRWAKRLTLGWLALMLVTLVLTLLWRATGHA